MSYSGYEDLRPDGTFRIEKGYSGSGYGGHSGYGGGGGYGGGCSIGICEILAVGAAIAVAVAAGAALFLAVQNGKRKKRSLEVLEQYAGLLTEGSGVLIGCNPHTEAGRGENNVESQIF